MSILDVIQVLENHLGKPHWLNSIKMGFKDGEEVIIMNINTQKHPPLPFLKKGLHGGYRVVTQLDMPTPKLKVAKSWDKVYSQ